MRQFQLIVMFFCLAGLIAGLWAQEAQKGSGELKRANCSIRRVRIIPPYRLKIDFQEAFKNAEAKEKPGEREQKQR